MKRRAATNLAALAARVYSTPQACSHAYAESIAEVLSRRLSGARMSERAIREAFAGSGHAPRVDEGGSMLPAAIAQALSRESGRRRSAPRDYEVADGVALVPVLGLTVKNEPGMDLSMQQTTVYGRVATAVADAAEDPAVRAIMLVVDSGGGETVGCMEAADAICACRGEKPIGAFVDGVAASAAYCLLSAADRGLVYTTRAALAGSIGTLLIVPDYSDAYAREGVRHHIIKSGAWKAAQHHESPKSDEELEYLQAFVDSLNQQFVSTIAAHRGLDEREILGQEAALFVGAEAIDRGLADHVVSSFDEAIEAVLAEADSRAVSAPSAGALSGAVSAPPQTPPHPSQNGADPMSRTLRSTTPARPRSEDAADPEKPKKPSLPPEEQVTAQDLREAYPARIQEIMDEEPEEDDPEEGQSEGGDTPPEDKKKQPPESEGGDAPPEKKKQPPESEDRDDDKPASLAELHDHFGPTSFVFEAHAQKLSLRSAIRAYVARSESASSKSKGAVEAAQRAALDAAGDSVDPVVTNPAAHTGASDGDLDGSVDDLLESAEARRRYANMVNAASPEKVSKKAMQRYIEDCHANGICPFPERYARKR